MQTSMPGKAGPPYAMMPSYITEFQSSPVSICGEINGRKWFSWVPLSHEESAGSAEKRTTIISSRTRRHLKHGEQRLGKVVKGAAPRLFEVEFPAEQLHAEEGEDDDEEEEQEQQGSDGADRIQQRRHQVGQRVPISAGEAS